MLRELFFRLQQKEVEVNLDPLLHPSILESNPSIRGRLTPIIRVPVNVYWLWYAISIIQARDTGATLRIKLDTKQDILSFIEPPNNFCVRRHYDSDHQISLSSDFGVGLATAVGHYLYNFEMSTLGKIKRTHGSKPDIKCITKANKTVIIEAKGTVSLYRQKKVIAKAQRQKMGQVGDAHIASCSHLKENGITNVKFVDPPVLPEEDPEYSKRLLMADHYARAFNLIGQKELSHYFLLMKKRILHDTQFSEFPTKEELFDKINKDYIKITVNNRDYLGNLSKIDNHDYLFTGADRNLITLQGFLAFKSYDENYDVQDRNNQYRISSDGVCIGLLRNLDFLEEQIRDKPILHYEDYTSFKDLDFMTGESLERYFAYIFKKIGITPILESKTKGYTSDMRFEYNGKNYLIEIKKKIGKKFLLPFVNLEKNDNTKLILICLQEIKAPTKKLITERIPDLIIISRPQIKRIVKTPQTLFNYL